MKYEIEAKPILVRNPKMLTHGTVACVSRHKHMPVCYISNTIVSTNPDAGDGINNLISVHKTMECY